MTVVSALWWGLGFLNAFAQHFSVVVRSEEAEQPPAECPRKQHICLQNPGGITCELIQPLSQCSRVCTRWDDVWSEYLMLFHFHFSSFTSAKMSAFVICVVFWVFLHHGFYFLHRTTIFILTGRTFMENRAWLTRSQTFWATWAPHQGPLTRTFGSLATRWIPGLRLKRRWMSSSAWSSLRLEELYSHLYQYTCKVT